MRNRIIYTIGALGVIALGLASRSYADRLPTFVAAYAGDTLWALTAFLGIGILFPGWSTIRVGSAALLFAAAIEVSQLYHAPWIDDLRHIPGVGLILGFGFLWSDLACYCVGVCLGIFAETLIYRRSSR